MMPDPSMLEGAVDPMAMGQDPGMGMEPGMEEDPFAGLPVEEEPMPEGQMEGNPLAEMPMEEVIQNINLAKTIKKKKDGDQLLADMASEILDGVARDERSRSEWIDLMEEGLKLALLLREEKSFPWPKASNIKYPLIATAAMQFSARAYPALVPSDGGLVKARVIPQVVDNMFLDPAVRIAKHMSWQLMVRNPEWETEMDKLLMTLSVAGTMFKKTYFDEIKNRNESYIIYPQDFIIDYHATTLEGAYRKTEVKKLLKNEIVEKVNNEEEFLDLEYGEPSIGLEDQEKIETGDSPAGVDSSTPHVFYECHTYWDLDEDGYEEPVVITVHRDSRQVARVTARFTSDSITSNADGKIIRIDPLELYTNFTFIENPAGSLYGMGFGALLGPINEAINTAINQLVDAGTLNNLQSGFISKSLRMNMGAAPLQPGEYRVVQATGEEMKNGIVPLPVKEPSQVLMSLIQMLISSGMQLASVAEIFVGKMPGQNTPATTTQQTVEQSMAVFTAVYKRVYRSLAQEFKKLMFLNKINPNLVADESLMSGLQISPQDYQLPESSIIPGADPSGDSMTIKQQKFAFVSQMLLPLGTIDPQALTAWAIEFMEIPNGQKLIMQPQPPAPDPKAELIAAQTQAVQQESQMKQEDRADERAHKEKMAALKLAEAESKIQNKAQQEALDRFAKQQDIKMSNVERVNKMRASAKEQGIKSAFARHEAAAKFAENRQAHQQKMQQKKESKPKEK